MYALARLWSPSCKPTWSKRESFCVDVRVEDIGEAEPVSLGRDHVPGDIPLRIDDGRDTPAGAADQIGGAGTLFV